MNASASSNIMALRSCIDLTTRISPTVVPEICARVGAGHGARRRSNHKRNKPNHKPV